MNYYFIITVRKEKKMERIIRVDVRLIATVSLFSRVVVKNTEGTYHLPQAGGKDGRLDWAYHT